MLDYLSRINDIPLCDRYDNLKCYKLQDIIYPQSVLCVATAIGKENIKEKAKAESIPEFMRNNIVENDVYGSV